jgi:predicted SAM-dependent methyltransferase
MQILLGCGSSRVKKLVVAGRSEWDGLVTLDHEASHHPDVVHDLYQALPFEDSVANEIHAYEVLEHVGSQGDYKEFFRLFSEIWRVLEDKGYLIATVPKHDSPWAWGDPSHTRVILRESLVFLSQPAYDQVGISPMSDFRSIYKADFDLVHLNYTEHCMEFVLQAVKPSRIKT